MFLEIVFSDFSVLPLPHDIQIFRLLYLFAVCTVGEIVIVEQSSLHLMSEKSYLGISSDGKVLCTSLDAYCTGYLEIKCPHSILPLKCH